MKKLFVFIFAILLSLNALAQLEVKPGSFKEVEGFVNVNPDENYQLDDNDLPFAVIKVRTENINEKERKRLSFSGNMGTFIMLEYKDGEVWVYLTARYADYLKISHPDFSSTEFTLPYDLKAKHGYEMTLVNKKFELNVPVKEIYNFLIVSADQSDATIYIDNEFAGVKEAYKSFKAGEKHSWRIECDLYHAENGEAVIPDKDGENVTINKALRPAFGYLNVTSSPESDAFVFIDGKNVGKTPYKSNRLASGEHRVRVMKEMFSAVEKTFTVTDGNTIQASMSMSANFVTVTITTDSESDIYVDNEMKGKGRWNGRLGDGAHSLEARKASHKTSIKNVQLALGTNESIVIPNPEPIYGTVEVVSNPIGANIIIDGKNYGSTPRVLTNVLVGTRELRLEKSGCAPMTKTITLDDKNTLSINEKLQTGREISISTDGNGDKILIDGNYVGTSPLKTTLTFGEHNVTAVRDSKETTKKISVAQTGGDTSVQLTFSTGAINGVFSVSSSKKVQFSKGNLQYQASTKTWRFAEHQWDMIGDANKNISSSYSGWIDLFGWGTGNNPTKSSESSSDYSSFTDWGNNTISNGVGKSWFTLTYDEWVYVFDTRSTSSGIRYAKATVNGVNGVILLPDNWSSSNYSLSNTNKSNASFGSNRISQTDWTNKFEANGAVFLPAAGYRSGTGVYYVGSYGYYWSATYKDGDDAYSVYFYDGNLIVGYWGYRGSGQGVRLVCSAEN